MKHGKGLFIWADGSTFEGDFKYNNIEGFGKIRGLLVRVLNYY